MIRPIFGQTLKFERLTENEPNTDYTSHMIMSSADSVSGHKDRFVQPLTLIRSGRLNTRQKAANEGYAIVFFNCYNIQYSI